MKLRIVRSRDKFFLQKKAFIGWVWLNGSSVSGWPMFDYWCDDFLPWFETTTEAEMIEVVRKQWGRKGVDSLVWAYHPL